MAAATTRTPAEHGMDDATRDVVQTLLDGVAHKHVAMAMANTAEMIMAGVNAFKWYRGARRDVEVAVLRYLHTVEEGSADEAAAHAQLTQAWHSVCLAIMRNAIPELQPLREDDPRSLADRIAATHALVAQSIPTRRWLLNKIDGVDEKLYFKLKITTVEQADVMRVLQGAYERFGVDMRPRHGVDYGEHLARIRDEAWHIVRNVAYRRVMAAAHAHVTRTRGHTRLGETAREACNDLFRMLARGVMFLTLHLVDRDLAPDHNAPFPRGMLDNRFGRTYGWLLETGATHGRWPVVEEPEPEDEPAAETVRDPTRTPSPVPMDFGSPPKTVRRSNVARVTEAAPGDAPGDSSKKPNICLRLF